MQASPGFTVAARLSVLIAFVLVPQCSALLGQTQGTPANPPTAPVRPVTENYYGTEVTDPYRYMENLKDPEVQAWMKAQNDHTRAVLASIPGREQLLARVREFDRTVPLVQAQRLPGDSYLIKKALPMENVAKLYLRRGLNGQDKLLADPEKIALTLPTREGEQVDLHTPSHRRTRSILPSRLCPAAPRTIQSCR